MSQRYKVWTQLEVIDDDDYAETVDDSYVSVADVDTLKEAQALQRTIQDQFEGRKVFTETEEVDPTEVYRRNNAKPKGKL